MIDATSLPANSVSCDPPREAGRYPQTHRLTARWALVFITFGSTIVVCGLLALRSALSQLFASNGINPINVVQLAAVCIPFIGMGAWFIISAWSLKLVLGKDFIEERYAFKRRRFYKPAIAGKKMYPDARMGRVRGVVIYPVDREILPMKIEKTINDWDPFVNWAGSIPDILASPNEWRAHRKYVRIVQYSFLTLYVGVPVLLLLVSLARRRTHF